MFPFYNPQPLFPFGPFRPFSRGCRRRLKTITGIPVLSTTDVQVVNNQVRYNVNQADFNSLPNEGLFFLDVKQISPRDSDTLPVGLSESTTSGSVTQSLLHDALQADVQAGDLQANSKYLIYYNKTNDTYQLTNAYPATITAPAS